MHTSASGSLFHITTAEFALAWTVEEMDLGINKTALLYADKVKIFSAFHALAFMLEDGLAPGGSLYEEGRRNGLTDKQVKKHMEIFRKNAHEQLGKAGPYDLMRASKLGLVEVYKFTPTIDPKLAHQVLIQSFKDYIMGVSTHILIDDHSAELERRAINQKAKVRRKSAYNKHFTLAADLFKRLPTFDSASIGEIIDIRRELDRPLVRFRSTIMDFSQSIKHEPWNEDFIVEADILFHKIIAPIILDIEDRVKSNRYLSELVRGVIEKPLPVSASSALAIAASQLSSLPALVSYAAGISAVTGAGAIAHDAYRKWKVNKQEIEQNGLFFYYRLKKRLSG